MKKCSKAIKILLVGEGGQGVQTIAKLLAKSAFEAGYHASYIPNFGTEQRGGISLAYVQVSCSPIIYPKFQTADVYMILSSRDIERSLRYIGKNTHIVYDKNLISPEVQSSLQSRSSNMAAMNAFETAIKELTERSFNIILLGILTGLVDKDLSEQVRTNMDKKFGEHYTENPKLKELNSMAFDIGIKLTIQK